MNTTRNDAFITAVDGVEETGRQIPGGGSSALVPAAQKIHVYRVEDAHLPIEDANADLAALGIPVIPGVGVDGLATTSGSSGTSLNGGSSLATTAQSIPISTRDVNNSVFPLPKSLPIEKVKRNIANNLEKQLIPAADGNNERQKKAWFKDFQSPSSHAVIADVFW